MKIGKTHPSINEVFDNQMEFQKKIVGLQVGELPVDNSNLFIYHVTALQEEIGELLKVDKRWKTHRNDSFNKEEKLKEMADCYITLINMAIYSGFSPIDIMNAISHKIEENNNRVSGGKKNEIHWDKFRQ